VRLFAAAAVLVWLIVQALGKTHLATDSPVNGGNLLILVVPVVFIFGFAFFTTLLDQLPLGFFRAREFVTAAFLFLLCAPLMLALLPPRRIVHAFPPYHPLYLQSLCDWMEKDEMMMGDLPWAIAWYGDRQCVWLPPRLSDARHQNDFYAIHDQRKPVRALHFSHQTLDEPMLTKFYVDQERGSWGHFAFGLIQAHGKIQQTIEQNAAAGVVPERVQAEIMAFWGRTFRELAPEGFPLQRCPLSYVRAGQLFLTDRDRWSARAP
jgi:hypothetical protein